MDYRELISNAKTYFFGGDFEKALEYSKKAIKEEPKETDGYIVAGQAALSSGDPNQAVQFFSDLVRISPKGDHYFLLGQAQAMNDHGMNALDSYEAALQNNCSVENKGMIYKVMSMLDVEMGKYEDGIKNIENASEFIGLDLELLKNKYLCYAGLDEYKTAIAVCNQMKLIAPSSYEAYSMAFEILIGLDIYDEAEKELDRAKRSVAPLPQSYYEDKVKFILVSKTQNDRTKLNDDILREILKVYDESLFSIYKYSQNYDYAYSTLIRASQTYLELKDGANALRLTKLLWDIPAAYAIKSSILPINKKTVDEMKESYHSEFFNKLAETTIDERSENFKKVKESLTPLKEIPNKTPKTDTSSSLGNYELDNTQKEIIWGLEISAYDLLKDYENELKAAEHLQGSEHINSNYLGKYTVLKCNKLLKTPNWEKNYRNAIGFWKNQRLENPDDILALPYEIRCLIDLGRFGDAEVMINKLPSQNKQYMEDLLKQEKSERQ